MPKIPELKTKKIIGFKPDFQISTEDIPYLNKIKEKARQKRLVVMKEASEATRKLEEETYKLNKEAGGMNNSPLLYIYILLCHSHLFCVIIYKL